MEQDATTAATTGQGGERPARHRVVVVAPPDRRRESAAVLRLALVVAVVALLWIGRRGAGLGRGGDVPPWQVAFASLSGPLQRQVRELHEACDEALRFRGDQGRWPTVEELAADGIAPFSIATTACARATAPWIWQYAARPSRPDGARALLFQAMEPRPGDTEGSDPRFPPVEDEVHRLLKDGTLLHVSFWIGPPRARASESAPTGGALDRFVADPALEGFVQVLHGLPATEGGAAAVE